MENSVLSSVRKTMEKRRILAHIYETRVPVFADAFFCVSPYSLQAKSLQPRRPYGTPVIPIKHDSDKTLTLTAMNGKFTAHGTKLESDKSHDCRKKHSGS